MRAILLLVAPLACSHVGVGGGTVDAHRNMVATPHSLSAQWVDGSWELRAGERCASGQFRGVGHLGSASRATICKVEEGRWHFASEQVRDGAWVPRPVATSRPPSDDEFDFEVFVLPDRCVRVDDRQMSRVVALPEGPAGDALRAHPELVGAAVVTGLWNPAVEIQFRGE